MRIVIASDKFKNSLTSFDVCEAVAKGFHLSSSEYIITPLPLSDGGDGLAEVMAFYTPSKKHTLKVSDPLQRPIEASFFISNDGKVAFIEMATASGLRLLQPHEYNPLQTTTYGTGELVKAALEKGVRKIILGIGGSATNDGGMGMAAALGYRFLDEDGKALQGCGENLIRVKKVDASGAVSLKNVTVEIACDVTNYLTGPEGAAAVYAPQKGATPDTLAQLEKGMLHFAQVVRKDIGIDMLSIKGGGAAGGTGAGGVAFLGAQLVSGIELLFAYSRAEEKIREADLVITGEGKIDEQTLHGKLIAGITRLCTKYNKPVIAVCGALDVSVEQQKELQLTAAFSILSQPMSLQEAYANAFDLLTQTAYNIAQLYQPQHDQKLNDIYGKT